jgi:hypothetical protein
MSGNHSERSHFEKVEKELNKDLASGHEIKAASLLLREFESNPEEARALVKKSMSHPGSAKLHLGIKENGDVIVWDPTEHRGVYAGSAPDLAPKPRALPPLEERQIAPRPEPHAAIESVDPPLAPPAAARGVEYPYMPSRAVCHSERKFNGLNLGIIKVGVFDNKSFGVGVDIGIASVNPMIGGHTGVDARVGFAQLGVCAAPGLDIDENGIQPSVRARANIVNLVGGGGEAAVRLGPSSLVHVEGDAEALGAHARADESLVLNQNGAFARHSVDAGYLDWVGGRNQAHANLSDNTGAGASATGYVGPASLEAGGGVETDGDRLVRPGAYVDLGAGNQHAVFHGEGQVGPAPDVRASLGVTSIDNTNPNAWRTGSLQAGVGVNGIGIRGVDADPRRTVIAPLGVGRDYEPSS